MARRARRQTQREKAKLQKIAEKIKNEIGRSVSSGMQSFAIQAMNDLAEAGPVWSGEFAASWRFVPAGQDGGAPGQGGSIYRYSKKDIRITTIEKYFKAGVRKFQIVNVSSHANFAIDQDTSSFIRPDDPPIDPSRLQLGDERNNPSLRYEIGFQYPPGTRLQDAEASRTADPDWYYTYVKGGQLNLVLNRSIKRGFETEFSR